MKLRANIFTTMLQLSEEAQEEFDEGDVCKVLDSETRHAIESVWMQAFGLLKVLVGMCVKFILCIQLTTKLPLETALMLLLSIPVMLFCMLFALRLRRDGDLERFHLAFLADENWNAYVIMCEKCRPVILQYKKGWAFTRQFNELHKAFNGKNYTANAESSNTLWMVQYVFVVVGSAVVLLGGHAVQDGTLGVGGFLILIKAVQGFGNDLQSVAKIFQAFISGSAAVKKIAHVLNAQTRRQERITSPEDPGSGMVEDEQIMLEEVSYSYPMTQRGLSMAVPKVNLSLPTGYVICFPADVGNVGLNTLFRIMARDFVPQTGKVFVPCQWRLVYVPVRPILFDGTLMYNLQFGDQNLFGNGKRTNEIVWNICRALGMSPELLHRDDYDVGSSGCCLKFSDMVIISITRALAQHVDLLLISSALDVLGQSRAVKVLRFLRKYTQDRGLPEEQLPMALRRRKTVVYTTKYRMLREQAEHRVEEEQLNIFPI
jgi:ABC-type multidrug transport system fused ATPase/permease subunit